MSHSLSPDARLALRVVRRRVAARAAALAAALNLLATGSAQHLQVLEFDDSEEVITVRLSIVSEDDDAINSAWREKKWQRVLDFADHLIDSDKKTFGGYALRYLACTDLKVGTDLKGDRALATKTAIRALRELGGAPTQLAKFCRRALFARPTLNEYQLALMALVPIVPDARANKPVRIAHVQALLGCGKSKEAVATNKTIIADFGDDTVALSELAHAICDTGKNGRPMAEIATRAVEKVLAESAGPDAASRMLKYRVLQGPVGDVDAARTLGKAIIAEVLPGELNNWTWDLLTHRDRAGRYPSLAIMAANKLATLGEPGYHEFDTMALAHFENGRIDDAIRLQIEALQAGGRSEPEYRHRLERYRAAKIRRDATGERRR